MSDRKVLLLACIAVVAGTVVFYAGSAWISLLAVVLMEGVPTLAYVLACAGVGYGVLRVLRLIGPGSGVSTLLGFCTSAGMGLGLVGLLGLGLGLAGWLSPWLVLVLLLIVAITGVVFSAWPRFSPLPLGEKVGVRSSAWLLLLVMPALAMALLVAGVIPGIAWRPDDPHPYDVLSYHLQVPREWYELGKIVPLQHNVFSFFPFGVEIHYLLGMHLLGGPWKAMYFAQFLSVAYSLLMVLTVYETVRVRAGHRGAIIAAVAAGGMPWVVMLGSVAYVESGLMFYTALTLAWLLREPTNIRTVILAGLAAGLACGIKYTAVPMLVIGSAVAMIGVGGSEHRWRTRLVQAGVFSAVALLVMSPWLIRNAVWTGNPVFPLAMNMLGQGHFTDVQVERFAAAHAPRPDQSSIAGRLQALWVQVISSWQYGWIVIPLAVAGFVARFDRHARALGLLLLFMLLIWLFMTHLQGRFLTTAIPVLLIAIGLSCAKPWFARAAGAGAVIAVVISVLHLHPRVQSLAMLGREGLFGLEHSELLMPPEIQPFVDSPASVVLVGEAAVFHYTIPMDRLRYRTVFDVQNEPGDHAPTAWRRGMEPVEAPAYEVTNYLELIRLSGTYRHIPPPSATEMRTYGVRALE